MFEVPFDDQFAVTVDVNVPRAMVALPREKDVIPTPEFPHAKCYRLW